MIENKIKTQKFIVKYFTEIMIKGDRAKRQMLSQLLMNLQKRTAMNCTSYMQMKEYQESK